MILYLLKGFVIQLGGLLLEYIKSNVTSMELLSIKSFQNCASFVL
jgi:hypothetical protein